MMQGKWLRGCAAAMVLAWAGAAHAADESGAAVAKLFGAREDVEQASLSPDGSKVAFLVPGQGQAATLFTVDAKTGATPVPALAVSGKPDRLRECRWVSNNRLVCTLWGMLKAPDVTRPIAYSRLIAVDAGGGNQKMLTNRDLNRRYAQIFGGDVLDWLPGSDGEVLLARWHSRTDQTGTNIGARREGLSVDRVDSRTLRDTVVEQPRADAVEYITDGKGDVRIAGFERIAGETQQRTGIVTYRFRARGSRDWLPLGDLNTVTDDGFNPYAVDAEKDVVYGFRKVDGRKALFTRQLTAGGAETQLLARADVDVDGLLRIGRSRRVVGASFATERRNQVYFDKELEALAASLGKALPKSPQISFVDASTDETKLLVFAGSDDDPGTYYLLDRTTKALSPLLQARPRLAGRALANVQAVTVPTRDGIRMPAYLTLPPGMASAKGLPAIVMPHGGPAARDEWGFDWLPQFFAARGYAVLQPQFRGSEGYGDDYQLDNGFRSWRTAIGDVTDAGRWLVAQGIADPARLGIVGWSYGGYAALQSAVMEPALFKGVVAIAPVTDFTVWKQELEGFTSERVRRDYVGTIGNEASPAQNAAAIRAPVLLVHGVLDANVGYGESELMHARLKAAGKASELIVYPELDHFLEDSDARAQLLEKSDALLRKAFGM